MRTSEKTQNANFAFTAFWEHRLHSKDRSPYDDVRAPADQHRR